MAEWSASQTRNPLFAVKFAVCSSPLFESCSGHLLDLFSVVLSSKPG